MFDDETFEFDDSIASALAVDDGSIPIPTYGSNVIGQSNDGSAGFGIQPTNAGNNVTINPMDTPATDGPNSDDGIDPAGNDTSGGTAGGSTENWWDRLGQALGSVANNALTAGTQAANNALNKANNPAATNQNKTATATTAKSTNSVLFLFVAAIAVVAVIVTLIRRK